MGYDKFPIKLKNQIFHIWKNFLNKNKVPENITQGVWKLIHDSLAELHGLKELHPSSDDYGVEYYQFYRVTQYFEKVTEIDSLLDIVEKSFEILKKIEPAIKKAKPYNHTPFTYTIENAIEDLNDRFSHNRIGYELKNGRIIKIDKELLHKKIVDITLILKTG